MIKVTLLFFAFLIRPGICFSQDRPTVNDIYKVVKQNRPKKIVTIKQANDSCRFSYVYDRAMKTICEIRIRELSGKKFYEFFFVKGELLIGVLAILEKKKDWTKYTFGFQNGIPVGSTANIELHRQEIADILAKSNEQFISANKYIDKESKD